MAKTPLVNPEQEKAIKHGDGPLLIIAGAGTGKTTVITERIRYLLLAVRMALCCRLLEVVESLPKTR